MFPFGSYFLYVLLLENLKFNDFESAIALISSILNLLFEILKFYDFESAIALISSKLNLLLI